MTVRMVWAQTPSGVIGAGGTIPWHVPEDMARFRALTTGSVVVMGRRTWESLPERFRPLPDRENVVLTSRPLDGVRTMRSVEEVLEAFDDVWVIGGGEVYAAFLPHATELHVTEVDLDVPGDAFAPELGDEWDRAVLETGTSRTGVGYAFTVRHRQVASAA